MKAGSARVGADGHFCAVLHEPIERAAVVSTQVNGGEYTKRSPGPQVLDEHRLQQPQATPLDEGAEQINTVGRGHFDL